VQFQTDLNSVAKSFNQSQSVVLQPRPYSIYEYNADQMIAAVDYRLGGKGASEVVVLRRIRSRRLHVMRLLKPTDVPIS
jgi:hypothetical protein